MTTSTDGITWTERTMSPSTTPPFPTAWNQTNGEGIAYGNGTYVATGMSSQTRLATSTDDGVTWTAVVFGHSGTLNGNSRENVELSRQRAANVIGALRGVGAKGPFALASAGALDPVTTTKTEAAQAKNRRVVVVLVP